MKTLLLFAALALSINVFGQSKKEQIITLNNSIDSLNTVLKTTRDNASKDIGGLNTTIVGLNSEITQLKSDVSSLESSTTKLTKENDKFKLDLGELSEKNLELEAKLKAIEVEKQNESSPLMFNLIVSNQRASPAGIVYSDGTIMTIADYKIELLDANTVIAAFVSEYAAAVYLEAEKDVVRIRSEAGAKTTYTFEKTKDDEVIIFQNYFYSGLFREFWSKTYKKDLNDNWKLINCEGDCD